MPEISIVIPVLNGAAYISDCIKSILVQEVDVQVIVMDGVSVDGTQRLVQSMGNNRVQLVSEADGGQPEAINKGAALATGKWFNWLNADDRLAPGALRQLLALSTDATKVIAGKCRHVLTDGTTVAVGGTVVQSTPEASIGRYSMGQPAHFYNKAVFDQLGGVNASLHFCMDMDLWFRYLMAFGIERVQTIDTVMADFTLHPDSKTVAQAAKMRAEHMTLMAAVLHALDGDAQLPELAELALYPKVMYQIPTRFNRSLMLGELARMMLETVDFSANQAVAERCFQLMDQAGLVSPTDRLKRGLKRMQV